MWPVLELDCMQTSSSHNWMSLTIIYTTCLLAVWWCIHLFIITLDCDLWWW
jgi:hypothetical protein